MTEDAPRSRREGLAELAEDAVGFGGQELRLTRDLLLRPGAVMDAYDAHGSMAGGRYPKPMRYYVTLMGIYLVVIALVGGFDRQLESNGATSELFAGLAERAGKSLFEFQADMEQWYGLVSIPLTALFFGGATFLLVRRWSPGGDRQDFQQTFTYLNAYSVVTIPLGLFESITGALGLWILPVTFGVMAVTYARVGAGRWWRTATGAWLKGALLLLANLVALIPASLLMIGTALLGARFLP